MKIYILFTILFLSIMYSCSRNQDSAFNKGFEEVLKSYIKENPLELDVYSMDNKKYSFPSYHVYFNVKKNDTVISIIQLPHLSNFDLEPEKQKDPNEVLYNKINYKGFEVLEGKYPIVFFDKNDISNNLVNYSRIQKKVPTKFILKDNSYHVKLSRQDYLFKKGQFKRIIN